MSFTRLLRQLIYYFMAFISAFSLTWGVGTLTIDAESTMFDNAHAFKPEGTDTNRPVLELNIKTAERNSDYYSFFQEEYNSNEKFYLRSVLFSVAEHHRINGGALKKAIGISLITNGGVLNCSALIKLSNTSSGSFNEVAVSNEAITIIVPEDLVLLDNNGKSVANLIGERCTIDGEEGLIEAEIGGTYDPNYFSNVFLNTFFGKNFDAPFFFIENSFGRSIVKERSFISLSIDRMVNRSIYNDIQLLRSNMKVGLSIPDCYSNRRVYYNGNAFYDYRLFNGSSATLLFGLGLSIVGVAFGMCIILRKKKQPLNLPALSLSTVVLPASFLRLISETTIFGLIIRVVSPIAFWCFVIYSIAVLSATTVTLFLSDNGLPTTGMAVLTYKRII